MASDSQHLTSVLVSAGVAFAVLKATCSLVGWYRAIHEDRLYRRHLDQLYDKLDDAGLGATAQRFFRQFYIRSRTTWFMTKGAWRRFALLSFGFNLVIMLTVDGVTSGGGLNWRLYFGKPFAAVYLLAIAATGAVLDMAFGAITQKQLGTAVRSGRSIRLGLFVLKDVGLAAVATYLNLLVAGAVVSWLGASLGAGANLIGPFVSPFESLQFLAENSPAALVLFIMGASLPTAIYVTLGLVVVVARATPARLQEVVKRVILNVTVDSSPVFSQVGTLLGSVGAVLVAVVSWLINH